MSETPIVISRKILNDGQLWEEIQRRSTKVPREMADECDQDVMDAMKAGDEKMEIARARFAERAGKVLFD